MLAPLVRNTIRGSAIYFIGAVLVSVTGLITLPIFARVFVPAEYGVLSLAMVIVSIGSAIAGGWLASSVNRFFPYYKRIGKLDTFYSSLLFSMIVSLVVLCVLGTPIYFLVRGLLGSELQGLMPLVALLIAATMAFSIFLANFRIKMQAMRYVAFNIGHVYLGLAIGLPLVIYLHVGVAGIFWGQILAAGALGAIMFTMLFLVGRRVKVHSVSLPAVREFATFGLPLIAAAAGAWILAGSDRYIIGFFWGTADVGLYSMGYNIANISVALVVSSIMLGIGPAVINVWESDHREMTGRLLSQLTRIVILIALPATVGISLLGKQAVELLATPGYFAGSSVIPFVAAGIFILGLCALSSQGLGLAKRTGILARNYLLVAAINIALNFAFVPEFGFIAAAVTTTVSYAILLALNTWSANRYLKWVIIRRSVLNSVIASIVMAGAVLLVMYAFSRPLVICPLGIVTGAVVYFGTLFLLREFSSGEISEVKSLIRESLPWLRGKSR